MDNRWEPVNRDSLRDFKVYIHPTASMNDTRIGAATDGVDLTPYVSQGSHTQFDCTVTLNWNYELFGKLNQPKPGQVLEVRMLQNGIYYLLWLGIVESINSYTLSRGERSMQLSAKSRDTLDLWRTTKRLTELFPQLTDMAFIARKVAKTTGLTEEEILIPTSGYTTAHTNTQLADMSAWEMLTAIFLPMGWTPFIDGQGRLRAAIRNLQGLTPDVVLEPSRVVKVVAQRHRPPVTRMRLKWLNPVLKRSTQQARKLADATIAMPWFIPYWRHSLYFSDDWTQRAEKTWIKVTHHADLSRIFFSPDEEHSWEQTAENKGKITLDNKAGTFATAAALIVWEATSGLSYFGTPAMVAFWILSNIFGTGSYEIWGTPFDWVHARNTTEAFDSSAFPWADNPKEIESDFIINEAHAQAVSVRELIYSAREVNKWTVQIVDDPRIEYGDVIQFPDGGQMYVEDFSRTFTRGSEATLEVRGFLVGATGSVSTPLQQIEIPIEVSPLPLPPPGGDPGGPNPPPGSPGVDYRALFLEMVTGKPYTQAALLEVEGALNAAGWQLSPADATGARNKVKPPNSAWVRVGFTGSDWEWVPDAGATTGLGTQSNPIIAMSTNLTSIRASVTASATYYVGLYGPLYGLTLPQLIDQYVNYCKDPAEFGNQKWYQGWNRYWETRLGEPGHQASANSADGSLPSIHQ